MDLLLILLHALFFAPVIVRVLSRRRHAGPPPARVATLDIHARAALAFHGTALVVFYGGVAWAFGSGEVAGTVATGSAAGAAMLALGAVVHVWSVRELRSWRLAPRIDAGHELCTTGPYALVRHPIYLAIDLLALGTALWLPAPAIIAGALALVAGGEVRARLEERALTESFGDAYVAYAHRVNRMLPGIY